MHIVPSLKLISVFCFSHLSTLALFSSFNGKNHKYFPVYLQDTYLQSSHELLHRTSQKKSYRDLPQLWVIWTRKDLTSFIGVMLTKIPVSLKQDLPLLFFKFLLKKNINVFNIKMYSFKLKLNTTLYWKMAQNENQGKGSKLNSIQHELIQ